MLRPRGALGLRPAEKVWAEPRLSSHAGDPAAAVRLSQQLLALGADVTLRSRWTNMNALHYAAYFDVPDLVRVLLKGARPRGEEEAKEVPGWGDLVG